MDRKTLELGDFQDRFWRKVDKTNHDGCWFWTGAVNSMGYGMIWNQESHRPILAHRASLALSDGSVSEDMEVIHSCDNPQCVNPDHLRQATHLENMMDKVIKGRQPSGKEHAIRIAEGIKLAKSFGAIFGPKNPLRGEKHPFSKLTDLQVIEIRERAGTSSVRRLSRDFGVSRAVVDRIVKNQTWKHLRAERRI